MTAGLSMIAREDLLTLFELQGQTIDRIHPSWLPEIAPELGSAARVSPQGRRWLANRLSEVSPPLFSLPAASSPTALALHQARWFMTLLQNPLECALDLGSLALAASVRTVITRAGVSKLRTVLGPTRYSRVLSGPGEATNAAATAGSVSAPEDLSERLIRCGAHELAAYAAFLHPALAASVRLSFECNWWDTLPAPLLTPAVAAACLKLRAPRDGDGDD
jgi:hypothetical protein